MIADFHTHILPGIDDGAQTVAVSRSMLDMLKADGVTDVVLTPHFYVKNQRIEDFLARRNASYKRLLTFKPEGVNFHLGAEAELSLADIDYECYKDLSIGGGKYILIEFPYSKGFDGEIFNRLERLMYQSGLIPIIAHIERYRGVKKSPGVIADLISLGCLIQVNIASVISAKRGSLVDAIFKNGQVHLLGSDCHDTELRRPEYLLGLDAIRERYGDEILEGINNISEGVLAGKTFRFYTEKMIKKSFGKYK